MLFERLREDIQAIRERDPAARTTLEILLCYPGLHAIRVHRLNHYLWRKGWVIVPRMLSQLVRLLSSIEIHPGAAIGRRLFIDHGCGTVIGETAEIGDDVSLYHDVTLGGVSLKPGKRHPTVADGAIIGPGAQVLGPIVIGAGARIGSNSVIVDDVPAGVTMVGVPARPVDADEPVSDAFAPYAMTGGDLPDPVFGLIEKLSDEIVFLQNRIRDLESARGIVTPPAGDSWTSRITYSIAQH